MAESVEVDGGEEDEWYPYCGRHCYEASTREDDDE